MNETPLLVIRVDGEVVAEAQLAVYDEAKAWDAFCNAFAQIPAVAVGEIFNAVRVGCSPELREMGVTTGLVIEMSTSARPQLVVPGNAAFPEMRF